jgi:hypothetical protein
MRHLFIGLVAMTAFAVGCVGSSGQSPAAATSEITSTWEAFFGPTGNANQVQGMDAQLQQVYQKAKTTQATAGLTAHVSSVVLQANSDCQTNGIPAPCAKVTYDLLLAGKPALSGATGYATRVAGKWLVSKNTFCALEALGNGGKLPSGC